MAHKFINGSLVNLTSEELKDLQAKEDDWLETGPLRLSTAVRKQRDRLLSDTDWMALSDSPVMSPDWATYRQALRDVSAQTGFPYDVNWPTKPE
tara:strand:+ start:839 stop:1120 length:282 start_codon:yes stop_codon:yes gene_type:complete